MGVFALRIVCPITKEIELFPRNCILSNTYLGKKELDKAFPELRCKYLEIDIEPKTKRVTFKCTHKKAIANSNDKILFKGKRLTKKKSKGDDKNASNL